jgi:hypothetical protein
VVPLPGESLVSLIRRTAAVMGYKGPHELRSLLDDDGNVQANLNPLGPSPTLNHLAILLRLDPEKLLSLTMHRLAHLLVLHGQTSPSATVCDSKTTLKYFARGAFPICPVCLKQDPVPYERLIWSLYALPVCVEHRCWLVGCCPDCQRILRTERPAASVCRCGRSFGDIEPSRLADAAMTPVETLEELFVRGASNLPGMSAAAMCWWTERLATAAAKTPAWIRHTSETLQLDTNTPADSIAWLAAAEMVRLWPDGFCDFLDVFQRVPKHHQTSTGVSRRFGMLLRVAARLEDHGFPVPAQALRQYLLERYAGGHLSRKICLFQKPENRKLLRNRTWIPQTEAASMLQARNGTINDLIERGILVGHVHAAGSNGRSVGLVQRESVETLRQDLESAVGVSTAARRLGLGITAVRDLIHDGVLPRAVRTNRGWRIPARSLSALETLCNSAKPIRAIGTQWISLREATRIFGPAGLTLSQLLALIQEGRVTARLADPDQLLHGLVVAKHKVEAVLPDVRRRQEELHGLPVHRLGKTLFPGRPVKVDVIKKWITAGLLDTHRVGRARMVSPSEIRRFRQTYCLREEVLRILGVPNSTLKRWQDAGKIQPAYPERLVPHAGLYLYRCADVELLRSAPRRRAAA